MEYIGKSNKFYTLWEVTSNSMTTSRGEKYTVIHHVYIKNISFDLNKAKEKYPNAIVDESLRGHSSWVSYDYPKPPVDEFCGGKYRGEKIAECTDLSYLHWAWDNSNIIPYESREVVIGILEKAGYRKINDTHIATPEEVEKIEKSFIECEEYEELLEKEGKLTITCPKNLDEEGELIIDNLTLEFPDFKTIDYYDYRYSLPIDSTGKGKKIKNKSVEIIPSSYKVNFSEYGWGASIHVIVKDFKVLK